MKKGRWGGIPPLNFIMKKGRWGGIPPWNFIMEKGEVGRIPPWNFIMAEGEVGWNTQQGLDKSELTSATDTTFTVSLCRRVSSHPQQTQSLQCPYAEKWAHTHNRHNLYSVLMQKSELTPTTDTTPTVSLRRRVSSHPQQTQPLRCPYAEEWAHTHNRHNPYGVPTQQESVSEKPVCGGGPHLITSSRQRGMSFSTAMIWSKCWRAITRMCARSASVMRLGRNSVGRWIGRWTRISQNTRKSKPQGHSDKLCFVFLVFILFFIVISYVHFLFHVFDMVWCVLYLLNILVWIPLTEEVENWKLRCKAHSNKSNNNNNNKTELISLEASGYHHETFTCPPHHDNVSQSNFFLVKCSSNHLPGLCHETVLALTLTH